jgi:hypothetical protein
VTMTNPNDECDQVRIEVQHRGDLDAFSFVLVIPSTFVIRASSFSQCIHQAREGSLTFALQFCFR